MITIALNLPAPDVEALIQGRMIAAISPIFLNPKRSFALYPSEASTNSLPIERYYRSNFLPIAQTALTQLGSETVSIKAWAICELCRSINDAEALAALSRLTIWTTEALQEMFSQRGNIFLAYLRVYHLLNPIEVSVNPQSPFLPLTQPLAVTDSVPVLSESVFNQRRHQLENRLPPLHPELEDLQSAIAQLANTNPNAKELERDISTFLGWSSNNFTQSIDSDLTWIQKIAEVGNSSDGQTFEKLVRRGLYKLGFRGSGLDLDSTGGAGGMDFYCETPYPVVGECKATKTEKVPDGTPAQLLKIGMNHLGADQYNLCLKLIVAAGELNFYANRTATENKMNIIRPETLQSLVELQAKHKNSVDLLELQKCLQEKPFGLADDKVKSYIEKVKQNIKLRSHIVQLVRNHLEKTGDENASVNDLYVAYVYSNQPQELVPEKEKMYEILIELSSPLTGYLGRNKGSDWRSDRFYFLRDLLVD